LFSSLLIDCCRLSVVNRTLHTFTNTSQLYYKMSALKYIRPIPNIDSTVRDIWAKC